MDYGAFENSLKLLAQKVKDEKVYFPYKIGCGLAGADWAVIKSLIEKYFPDAVIVRRPND